MKIYIPSKGRAGTPKTTKILDEAGLLYYMVVEPQDYHHYANAYGNQRLIVLPEDDQGLWYCRQHTLEQNDDWFIMLDDDIDAFRHKHFVDDKIRGVHPEAALSQMWKEAHLNDELGQVSLNYSMQMISETRLFIPDSFCDVAVAIHGGRVREKGIAFDRQTGIKVDRDFTIQVLASGLSTVRLGLFGFSAPGIGSNEGGLCDAYKTDEVERSCAFMEKKWGGEICRQVWKANRGRLDLKIIWKNAHLKGQNGEQMTMDLS